MGAGSPKPPVQGSRTPDKLGSFYEPFKILSPITEIMGTDNETTGCKQGPTNQAASYWSDGALGLPRA